MIIFVLLSLSICPQTLINMDKPKIVKYVFLLLLTITFCGFNIGALVKYFKKETTFSLNNQEVDQYEMPAMSFCFTPSTKPSVLQKYNFSSNPFGLMAYKSLDQFTKTIGNSTFKAYEELTYSYGIDFNLYAHDSYSYSKNPTPLNLGKNDISINHMTYELNLLETNTHSFGKCLTLKSNNLQFPVAGLFHFVVVFNASSTPKEDIPKEMVVFITSPDTYLGVTFGTWLTLIRPIVLIRFLWKVHHGRCGKRGLGIS